MNSRHLILLCLAALPLTAAATPAAATFSPAAAPPAAEQPAAFAGHPDVAALSDAECKALHRYLMSCVRIGFVTLAKEMDAAADAGAEKVDVSAVVEKAEEALATVSYDELPADFRDYLAAAGALERETDAKLAALDTQYQVSSHMSDSQWEEEYFNRRSDIADEHSERELALAEQFPRASAVMQEDTARRLFMEVLRDKKSFMAFAELHPEFDCNTRSGRQAAVRAYLHELAAQPLPEADVRAARELLTRSALHAFICYDIPYCVAVPVTRQKCFSLVLPQDGRSGYGWRLAGSLPEDAPVTACCRRLSIEQWENEENESDNAYEAPIPRSTTHVDILTLNNVREGDITLRFILCHEAEGRAVSTRELEYSVLIPAADREKDAGGEAP